MNHINTSRLSFLVAGIVLSLLFGYIAQKYRDLSNTTDRERATRLHKKGVFFIILSCLAMWLPSALRYNVGIDNDTYQMQFNAMSQLSDAFLYYEPVYGLLCYLCKSWFNDYQVLIFITAMITGGLMWRSIYKYSNSIVLCIVGCIAVNMYFMSFTVIRQFISIAILLNSVEFIKDRKPIQFVVLLILAASFHYTALIFGVLYLLYSDNLQLFTKKNILIVASVFLFFSYIDSILGSAFTTLSALREGYSDYEYSDASKNIAEIIFLLPVLLYALVYRKQLIDLNRMNSVLFWVVVMLFVSKAIGMVSPGLSRVHYYFVFCTPFMMSYSTKLKSNLSRLILPFVIIIYYVWSIQNIFEYQWEDFLPYQSILQK